VAWSPYRDQGQILIQAFLKNPGVLSFGSQTGRRIRIDAYLGESQHEANGTFSTAVVREALVGSPGTTEHAITVGAYMWNEQFDYKGKVSTIKDVCDSTPLRIGDISCYSSPGFSRTGDVKPDLAAPSDYFAASRARTADGKDLSNREVADSSGRYVPFNGTSAATPYTAGVIALLFQKNPRLNLGTLRMLLATHVTRDSFTGTTPNPRWGHGKLDLPAIDRLIDAVH
jgi:subtilisin family serine protease